MRRAFLLNIEFSRVDCLQLRIRTCLAAALQTKNERWLVQVRRDLRSLARVPTVLASSLHAVLSASLATFGRETSQAAARLQQAIAGFDASDRGLHAAAARYQLGRSTEQPPLVEQSERWMRGQGIAGPWKSCRTARSRPI